MSAFVTVREYARLTTAAVAPGNLDCAQISETAFDWLCELSASFNRNGATLLQVEGRRALKWDSYVGVLETPCGTRLEILPKHHEQDDCLVKSRQLLRKLIQRALQLKPRETSVASLELFDAPLSEWVVGQFLAELDLLVKRGVRFDYQRIEEEQRFLRGQLNVVAQMRQPPGRQHHFQIRHDVFLPDRAENRLLKLALEQVAKSTQDAANWRLANELRSMLAEVPSSKQVSRDLRAWSCDRLMAHYQAIKPWCELILNQQMPIAVSGEWRGMSLLFPMEKLFECYVEGWLRQRLLHGAKLTSQASRHHLCRHDSGKMFCLKPDLLIDTPEHRWILDTKWKRIDAGKPDNNYGLSQSDFYQLFAYGHKYRRGEEPRLVLIYPYWSGLQKALPVFDYGKGMQLWVFPFDLDSDHLLDAESAGIPLRQERRLVAERSELMVV
ncbi:MULTISPECIES: McrC family protein [Pseudomonas aeruginosa group]|uniref:McrC family protein n=1 Tax=Pseudomonas aeruginosa group TaxID=136841 RepID=UPI000EB1C846|nr:MULTISPECIES: McrC family protein [Pseudomonas aeruginosa group]MCT5069654.1 McrC family protein [Pseudomonas aeruginosa]MCT5447742.1 McrC family protein [Pseudomonas aeruginosa]MCT9633366.1 McrC family protein [Pseudomonas aeruginosa]MCW8020788.1 McrC family protein [Pseudomonas aeruginosa]MCW8037312.1 McrC family protein [Pseudomonas aeruginosa]